MKVANMAEYRVGRAVAGYGFATRLASAGFGELALGGLRHSERMFKEMAFAPGVAASKKGVRDLQHSMKRKS
jgi:hypothetical protein